MPQSDVNQPCSASAIDRLSLATSEVRGAQTNMPGMGAPCLACCCNPACFEVE